MNSQMTRFARGAWWGSADTAARDAEQRGQGEAAESLAHVAQKAPAGGQRQLAQTESMPGSMPGSLPGSLHGRLLNRHTRTR
jgi:hypothetical protein